MNIENETVAETPQFVLNEDQANAVMGVREWLSAYYHSTPATPNTSQTLTLGGFAGTGKTTVIKELVRRHRTEITKLSHGTIEICAFTGKAVSVLRSKGLNEARTLHNLMYDAYRDPQTGEMRFTRKSEEELEGIGLCIVDEASMISTELYQDLLHYGFPILFVGDMGQLEPIGDNPNLMLNPRLKLLTIHRQAAESDIIQLSVHVRDGLIPRLFSPNPVKDPPEVILTDKQSFYDDVIYQVDQVLCGFNRTRHKINTLIRKNRGFEGYLNLDERIICLQNNPSHGVFNGLVGIVKKIHRSVGYNLVVDVEEEGTGELLTNICMVKAQFGKNPIYDQPQFRGSRRRGETFWDYAYAMTVHKSQGSEFPTVAVHEEIWFDKWDAKRWRYTAITRASKGLVYMLR